MIYDDFDLYLFETKKPELNNPKKTTRVVWGRWEITRNNCKVSIIYSLREFNKAFEHYSAG